MKRKNGNNSLKRDEICAREHSLESPWRAPRFWIKKIEFRVGPKNDGEIPRGRRADGNSWWSHLPRTDDVRRTM